MWIHRGTLLTLTAWMILFSLPLVLGDWNAALFAQYVTYGIFALSLALIWGGAGILSFGQAIFFGIGAYSMALVTLGKLPFLGESQWTGLLLALLLPTLAAALLGWILFQGRALAGAHLGIVTLCAAVVAEIAARRWDFVGGFNGLFGIPPMESFDGDMLSGLATSYIVLTAALAAYLIALVVLRSPLGTILAAIRNDENRTAHFGYDVRRYKIFVFALSGTLAGLAGALFTLQFGFVSPTLLGFGLSTEVLIWVAVGGRSTLMAAFLGAMIVRSGESMLSTAFDQYWLLVLGIGFVATVVFAPQGLLGNLLRLPPPCRLARPERQPKGAIAEASTTPPRRARDSIDSPGDSS